MTFTFGTISSRISRSNEVGQHFTPPTAVRAQVCQYPAKMAVTEVLGRGRRTRSHRPTATRNLQTRRDDHGQQP